MRIIIDDLTKSAIAEAFGLEHLEIASNSTSAPTFVWVVKLPRFSLWIENALTGKIKELHIAMVETQVSRRAMLFIPTMDANKAQFTGYLPLSPLDLPAEKDSLAQALSCFDLAFQQNQDYFDRSTIEFCLHVATRKTTMDYEIKWVSFEGHDNITRSYHALLEVVRWLAQTYGSDSVREFLDENDTDRYSFVYKDEETGKLMLGRSASFMETGL